MKIAFPTNKGDKIAKHSSFCRSFLIIDTETQERTTLANPVKQMTEAEQKSSDRENGRRLGTGRIVPALLADAGVNIYVCFEAEEKFIAHLQQSGIAVCTTQERQIESALQEAVETSDKRDALHPDRREGRGRRDGAQKGFGRGRGMRQDDNRGSGMRQGRRAGRGPSQDAGQNERRGRGMGQGQGRRHQRALGQGAAQNERQGRGMGQGRRRGMQNGQSRDCR